MNLNDTHMRKRISGIRKQQCQQRRSLLTQTLLLLPPLQTLLARTTCHLQALCWSRSELLHFLSFFRDMMSSAVSRVHVTGWQVFTSPKYCIIVHIIWIKFANIYNVSMWSSGQCSWCCFISFFVDLICLLIMTRLDAYGTTVHFWKTHSLHWCVLLILFALCYEEIFDWDASTCCASRMRGNRRRSMRRRWEFARPWPVGVLWVQWGCSGKASSYGTAVWGRAVKAYCRHGRRSNKAVEGIYVLTVRFPLDAYRWRVRDCWNRRPQSLRDDLAWSEFAFEEVCEGN